MNNNTNARVDIYRNSVYAKELVAEVGPGRSVVPIVENEKAYSYYAHAAPEVKERTYGSGGLRAKQVQIRKQCVAVN